MNKGVCTICARGGSKGVPGKNVRELGGIPLIAHSIKQAKEAGLFKAIAVSSDCDEILAVSKKYGADITIKRPAELASDSAAKIPVIRHCFVEVQKELEEEFDFLVDLDATSPLRTSEDIKSAVELIYKSHETSNVFSVCPSRRSPYFNMVEEREGKISLIKELPQGVSRRQDSPNTYYMNASIYVWKRETILNEDKLFLEGTKVYVMPEYRSFDIDHPFDFLLVDLIFQNKEKIESLF
jgi:CMP-N,N'-diacetyllegionaminic acid synthase